MNPRSPTEPVEQAPELRRLRLRYAGTCVLCATQLAKGAEAFYDPASKTVRCLACPVPGTGPTEQPIDLGVAGGSASREFERRTAKREARIKSRFGNRLGGVILALTDEPQSTRAWARGARGEEKLANALADLPNIHALHDRRVPGTPGNIDHLLVAPAGVFVVDAKRYQGTIRIRDRGGLFRSDLRLYVGRRDCSELAEGMGWQTAAVELVLRSAALEVMPPITPVLCFVEGEWPLFRPPNTFRGVHLESTRSIRELITGTHVLDEAAIERLTRILATAFPPK
jgi:Nuclease-related domain.